MPSVQLRCRHYNASQRGKKGLNILAIKKKARTVSGRGEKSLLSNPGSELRLGTEEEKEKEQR